MKPLVPIYGRVLRVEAEKVGPHKNCDAACKKTKHRYFHDFKPGVRMYGLPDGSILLSSLPRPGLKKNPAYRGYSIDSNLSGDTWISKGGFFISYAKSVKDAMKQIDGLF